MKSIIIDCDPGVDDAVGLMLALASEELNVLGITTVAGNSTVTNCFQNALNIAYMMNKETVPVSKGEYGPLLRKVIFDGKYSGTNGMNGIQLPKSPQKGLACHSVDFMIETAKQHPGLTLVSTGPMTNIAKALIKYPDLKDHVSEIVTASGYYGINQDVPEKRCSWNIALDPESARIVFDSGIPIKAVGLDVTSGFHNGMFKELITGLNHPQIKEFLLQANEFNLNRSLESYSLLIDAVAVVYLLKPDIAEMKQGYVRVKCQETPAGDCSLLSPNENNTIVYAAEAFDYDSFVPTIIERLSL